MQSKGILSAMPDRSSDRSCSVSGVAQRVICSNCVKRKSITEYTESLVSLASPAFGQILFVSISVLAADLP